MSQVQKVSSLVTGGAASAGPPLGPALGPLGVNIMEIIKAINDRTRDFEGMKIPITVSVDTDTKEYEIEVGIPSSSPLIMKEAGIKKGSGASGSEWVGDITLDAVLKIAHTKIDSSYASSLKSVTKTIIGTCLALGVKVEGKSPKEITNEINSGKWDEKF